MSIFIQAFVGRFILAFLPSYVSQFPVLPKDDKSGEQVFNFKIFNQHGFEIGSHNVKESFLLSLSLSNQLVDATLIRDANLKEALKECSDPQNIDFSNLYFGGHYKKRHFLFDL